MSELNEIENLKKYYRYPTFFKKVLDHYDLWSFSRDTLETLESLCFDYYRYTIYIKEGKSPTRFDNIEEIRNKIEKTTPYKAFLSEVFGLADLKRKHLFVLAHAICFLTILKYRSCRRISHEFDDLFSKDIEDLKKDFFLYEKKVPSPFDSLTDEKFNELENFVYYHYVV